MAKIEKILTDCVEEIRSGKSTLSSCLDRYPSKRQELEPLLKTALNIQSPPALKLDKSRKQAARARLLGQIQATRQSRSWSFSDFFSFGIPPQMAWARVALTVLAVIIVVAMAGSGTAYAAQDSLPGDVLYPLKKGTEGARLLVAGDSADKAVLNLQFAQRRLEEMRRLAGKDEKRAGEAVNGYGANLEAAATEINKIDDTASLAIVLERASEDIRQQMLFCDETLDTFDGLSGPALEAGSLAASRQVDILEEWSRQDILRAARANLAAMEQRLKRAGAKAEKHQYRVMQEVILQYQQFSQLGEQILLNAQSMDEYTTEIESESYKVLSGCIERLDRLSQQVPAEYKKVVENSRAKALKIQEKTGHGYQHHGNNGRGAGTVDKGEGPDEGSQMGKQGPDSPGHQEKAGQNNSGQSGNNSNQGNGQGKNGENDSNAEADTAGSDEGNSSGGEQVSGENAGSGGSEQGAGSGNSGGNGAGNAGSSTGGGSGGEGSGSGGGSASSGGSSGGSTDSGGAASSSGSGGSSGSGSGGSGSSNSGAGGNDSGSGGEGSGSGGSSSSASDSGSMSGGSSGDGSGGGSTDSGGGGAGSSGGRSR
ncbi:MAG: hypothetical protein JXA46_11075 [Dehalococcoidales bacterium]|nr:hypothetical protein [Dehalococcoidales bacterium]